MHLLAEAGEGARQLKHHLEEREKRWEKTREA
jgi:hypothetical protein